MSSDFPKLKLERGDVVVWTLEDQQTGRAHILDVTEFISGSRVYNAQPTDDAGNPVGGQMRLYFDKDGSLETRGGLVSFGLAYNESREAQEARNP